MKPTLIQSEIRNYIIDTMLFGDAEGLEIDTPLHEGGILDSTGFLDIITYIEQTYQIQVNDSEVVPGNFDTLRKITSYVDRKICDRAGL